MSATPTALAEFERHDEGRAGVAQAIAAVMAELPAIGKGDKSPEGYAYRGIEAITKHLQPLLAKHGVVIVPSARVKDVRPSPAMKDGWTDTFVEVRWTIVGPDGSTLAACTNGIGRDRSDKGANKAQTQAFKYLLLHLLCIADKADDSDGLTYEHDRQERRQPTQLDPRVVALREALAGCEEPVQRGFVARWGKTADLDPALADEAMEWLIRFEPPAVVGDTTKDGGDG